jgi:PPP family 3-phenylpropionic acid transporter
LLVMGGALVVTALRWAVLGFSSSLWVLLLSQPLHAVSFAVYFVCAATYVARSAPAPLRHSGQALLSALVYGGGGALGSWIAGLVSAGWSVRGSFVMGAGLALVAALLMVLLSRQGEAERAA